MSTLSQFVGGAPTKSIVNHYSSGGVSTGVALSSGAYSNSVDVLSGALTAATLKTLLTVTGGGEVPLLFVRGVDATSRTVRVRVTVDGVVAFDATSSAMTLANDGIIVMGQYDSSSLINASTNSIKFNTSLVVDVASSLTETNKVTLAYALTTR